MPNKRDGITENQFWSQTMGNIFNDPNVFDQMNAARDQYPELVAAAALMSAYVAHTQIKVSELGNWPGIPVSVEDITAMFNEFFKNAPLILACANGDEKACKILDHKPPRYVPKQRIIKV